MRVSPTPNSYLAIDVPVVVRAEISGLEVEGWDGLAGVPVRSCWCEEQTEWP
jgi:hypothetical protein